MCRGSAVILWLSMSGDDAACLMQPMMAPSQWLMNAFVPGPCT